MQDYTFDNTGYRRYRDGLLVGKEQENFIHQLSIDTEAFKNQLKEYITKNRFGKDLKHYWRDTGRSTSAVMDYLLDSCPTQFKNLEYWLSMYESNESLRGLPDGYIGDEELRVHVQALLDVYPELSVQRALKNA